MKISIESTTKVVFLNGVQCRVWEGTTERGVPMHCYIARVAVKDGEDQSQFEGELREMRQPSLEVATIPLRLLARLPSTGENDYARVRKTYDGTWLAV
jgi:hypothetical protein